MPWVQRQPWCRCSWTDGGKRELSLIYSSINIPTLYYRSWSDHQKSGWKDLEKVAERTSRKLPVWPGFRQRRDAGIHSHLPQRTFSRILNCSCPGRPSKVNCETGNGDTFLKFYTPGTPVRELLDEPVRKTQTEPPCSNTPLQKKKKKSKMLTLVP